MKRTLRAEQVVGEKNMYEARVRIRRKANQL